MLIVDDTDLLALGLDQYHQQPHPLFFNPEPKLTSIKVTRTWDIGAVKSLLEETLCHKILLLHAISGCDTNSRIHTIGKGTVVKLHEQLDECGVREVFYSPNSTHGEVAEAGERQ